MGMVMRLLPDAFSLNACFVLIYTSVYPCVIWDKVEIIYVLTRFGDLKPVSG